MFECLSFNAGDPASSSVVVGILRDDRS